MTELTLMTVSLAKRQTVLRPLHNIILFLFVPVIIFLRKDKLLFVRMVLTYRIVWSGQTLHTRNRGSRWLDRPILGPFSRSARSPIADSMGRRSINRAGTGLVS